MNAAMELVRKRLDEEIEARLRKDGKDAAVAFLDGLLANHKKECTENCLGGTILREARAKLVNPLSTNELAKLGIEGIEDEPLPSTVLNERLNVGEKLTKEGDELLEIAAKMGYEATEMTKHDKLLFLAGMAIDSRSREQTITLAVRLGLVANINEFFPILIPAVAWFNDIAKDILGSGHTE